MTARVARAGATDASSSDGGETLVFSEAVNAPAGDFAIVPPLTISGKLPPGVRATIEPGMLKLAGTPAESAAHRTFHLTVSASNGIGDRSDQYTFVQHLVITVTAGSQS